MVHYNNNQWRSVVYRVLDQRRLFWHRKEKFRNTKRSWVFLIFLECVKITSVGLKLDRSQLQHGWSLLKHNRSENLNVVACRPTCTYRLWLCLWSSLRLRQSFWFWVMQAPVFVEVESCMLWLLQIWDVVVKMITQTCRFPIWISVLQNYNTGKQLTKPRQVHVMFCCRYFYCVRIEPHVLQAPLHQVLDQAIWPIKARYSHWLCFNDS